MIRAAFGVAMGFDSGGRRLVWEGAVWLQSSVPTLPPQLRRELPAEQHRVLRPHHRQLGGRDLHGNPALRRWRVCSPREVTGPRDSLQGTKDPFQNVCFSLCAQGDYRHQCRDDCAYLTPLALVVVPEEGGQPTLKGGDCTLSGCERPDHLSSRPRGRFLLISDSACAWENIHLSCASRVAEN